jgi:hypothetical protein
MSMREGLSSAAGAARGDRDGQPCRPAAESAGGGQRGRLVDTLSAA